MSNVEAIAAAADKQSPMDELTRLRKERNSAVQDLREIEAMLHDSENERTSLKKQVKQMLK